MDIPSVKTGFILFPSFPLLPAFDVGGLGFEFCEFCEFVAGWRHALRSEWPFIIIITVLMYYTIIITYSY